MATTRAKKTSSLLRITQKSRHRAPDPYRNDLSPHSVPTGEEVNLSSISGNVGPHWTLQGNWYGVVDPLLDPSSHLDRSPRWVSMTGHPRRIMLLTTPTSYRTTAFLQAAARLNIEVVLVQHTPGVLQVRPTHYIPVDFSQLAEATTTLVALAKNEPVCAVIPVDDAGTILAAQVAHQLGLPQNDPDAAIAARDKWVMRQRLQSHGVPVPEAQAFPALTDPKTIASQVSFPCVVKPTRLSGSRGVIRANTPQELFVAIERIRAILASDGFDLHNTPIIVEPFISGSEVALEGLLTSGQLQVLALFDKPDPLEGPFFEETIYVTPSRLPVEDQAALMRVTSQAAQALGLCTGPIHAELRLNEAGPWVIEIAGRSIGGLCSTILEFGLGRSLEEVILAHAVGDTLERLELSVSAAGVMMIPIPGRGILKGVEGIDKALQVPGITGVEITAKRNHRLIPLPEGASYLGFIFARGNTPQEVEEALRTAHAQLTVRLTPELPTLSLRGV